MNDTEAFLRKIRENPDDDAPRLVFADYLDEQSQTPKNKQAKQQAKWAGIIRAQIAAERESFADISLWNKWAGVDVSHGCKAASECVPKIVRTKSKNPLRRGFYDQLQITPETLKRASPEMLDSVAPFRKLILSQCGGKWNLNHDNPVLSLFRELDFEATSFRISDLDGIFSCEHLKSLSSLSLYGGQYLSENSIPLLLKSTRIQSLRNLCIVASVSDQDFLAFINSPVSSQIEGLRFGALALSKHRVLWLSQASVVNTLVRLHIDTDRNQSMLDNEKWGNFACLEDVRIDDDRTGDDLTPFVASQNWQHLKKLGFSGWKIRANQFSEFQCEEGQINLALRYMNSDSLETIVSSPSMRIVKALHIHACNLNDSIYRTLSRNLHLCTLRSLSLTDLKKWPDINALVSEICSSSAFNNLIHLKLDHKLSIANLKKLASSPLGESLRALSFRIWKDTKVFLDFFRDASNFPNLLFLNSSYGGEGRERNRFANGRENL